MPLSLSMYTNFFPKVGRRPCTVSLCNINIHTAKLKHTMKYLNILRDLSEFLCVTASQEYAPLFSGGIHYEFSNYFETNTSVISYRETASLG